MTTQTQRTRPGDLIIVEGHRTGAEKRVGEIVEVLGTPEHPHYRVRWDNGHETIFYPSDDARIQPARSRR